MLYFIHLFFPALHLSFCLGYYNPQNRTFLVKSRRKKKKQALLWQILLKQWKVREKIIEDLEKRTQNNLVTQYKRFIFKSDSL